MSSYREYEVSLVAFATELERALRPVVGQDDRSRVCMLVASRHAAILTAEDIATYTAAIALGHTATLHEVRTLAFDLSTLQGGSLAAAQTLASAVFQHAASPIVCSLADFSALQRIIDAYERDDYADLERLPASVTWAFSAPLTAFLKVRDSDWAIALDPDYREEVELLLSFLAVAFERMPGYGGVTAEQQAEFNRVATGATPRVSMVLGKVFFEVVEQDFGIEEAVGSLDTTAIAAFSLAAAEIVEAGADEVSAVTAAFLELAHITREDEDVDYAVDPFATLLFEKYLEIREPTFGVIESFERWVIWARRLLFENNVAWAVPLDIIVRYAQTVGTQWARVFQSLVDLVRAAVVKAFPGLESPQAIAVVHAVSMIFYGLADIVDPKHRQHPKTTWALLTSRSAGRLRNSEALLMQLPTFSYVPSPSYSDWARTVIGYLESPGGMDVSKLSVLPPSRAVFYPAHTYGLAANNDLELAVDVNFHETARETRAAAQAVARGAPIGIDGAWFGTAANVQQSIDRYVVPRPTLSSTAKMMISLAADSLFDDYPELYDRPQPMSVGAVMAATEWKYSAGLPFLPAIRTRAQLKNGPAYQAIARGVAAHLASGVHPGVAFHAFPKTDVVPRDKLIKDPSAMRTITAGDRFYCLAYNALLMERNKRVPPVNALVLNTIPRREGALQEVYQQITSQPTIVAADGWRFDSQVPSEVASIGSVRLYERGIQGWWGERAALSYVKAYYEAITSGLIVNLQNGQVTRKTGGGGTGSAATSTDNRDWTRLVLRASWALTFDKPPSEFKHHVQLGNASDDILMGVDDLTASRLLDWQEMLYVTYGLRFDFDVVPGPDPLLHLRLVPDHLVSDDDYDAVGVARPAFVIRHDPARLALKRSDYRSDRMRHNAIVAADHVATRAFGHLYLTAHSRDMYHDVLSDGLEAASEFLEYFFANVEWSIQLDDRGMYTGVQLTRLDGLGPGLLRDRARASRRGQEGLDAYVVERQKIARRWWKSHRFPAYIEVFKLWVTPQDWSKVRKSTTKWEKLAFNPHLPLPLLDVARNGLISMSALVSLIPSALTKGAPSLDTMVMAKPLLTSEMPIETFIFRRFVTRVGRSPAPHEFQSLVRQSPYGAACDAVGFIIRWSDHAFYSMLMDDSQEFADLVDGRLLVYMGMYTLIDRVLDFCRNFRILGFLVALFVFSTRDLDRIYSFLSLIQWVGTGRASVEISNVQPRDAFMMQKVLALLMMAFVPDALVRICFVNISRILPYLEHINVVILRAMQIKSFVANLAVAPAGVPPPVDPNMTPAFRLEVSPWVEVVEDIWNPRAGQAPLELIIGGVGTGKSTAFVRDALGSGHWPLVWILMPTNLLVNTYATDLIPEDRITRLFSAEDVVPITGVVVSTAGLLAHHPPELVRHRTTLFLFDEAHMAQTEQIVAWVHVARMSRVMLTATPGGVLIDNSPHLRSRTVEGRTAATRITERPAVMQAVNPDGTPNLSPTAASAQLEAFIAVKMALSRDSLRRAVVVVPSIKLADRLVDTLRSSSFEATVVSSASPVCPLSGVVVATPVVDVGVNLAPPCPIMIDTGVVLVQRPCYTDLDRLDARTFGANFSGVATKLEVVWSSSDAMVQRHGRVGRTIAGVVYSHPLAGTGPPPPYRANVLLMLKWSSLPQVAEISGVKLAVVPSKVHPQLVDWVWVRPGLNAGTHLTLVKVVMLAACELGGIDMAIQELQNHVAGRVSECFKALVSSVPNFSIGDTTPGELHRWCRSVGFAMLIDGIPIVMYGRPLVHYRRLIAPSGYFASIDDC